DLKAVWLTERPQRLEHVDIFPHAHISVKEYFGHRWLSVYRRRRMTNRPDPKGEPRGVLRNIVATDTPESLQRRGADYWARGAVRLSVCGTDEVTAVVRGTRPYTLRLSITGGQLSDHCDCPHAARGVMCKHVWAFVLEVEHAARCREFVAKVAALPNRVARASATIPQAVSPPAQPGAPRPN